MHAVILLPIRSVEGGPTRLAHALVLCIRAYPHNLQGVGVIQACLEGPANGIEMGVIRFCQALIHNCDFLRGRGVAGVEPAPGYDRYSKRLKEVRSNIV